MTSLAFRCGRDNRRAARIGLALVVMLFCAGLAAPGQGQIRAGAAYLKIIPGARQQGIASSLTGVIDEMYATYANPGAAGFLREWQWSASYTKWIPDTYHAAFYYGSRLPTPWRQRTRFALAFSYLGVPEFDSSERGAAPVSANDWLLSASFGQPFRWLAQNFSLGTNLKYFNSTLAQFATHSLVFDFGLLFRTDRFRFFGKENGFLDYGIFSAGIAVTQLGKPLTFVSAETPLPLTVRSGVALNVGTHKGLQLQLSTDYQKVRDEKGGWSTGMEISWGQLFTVRSGYQVNDNLLGHFSFGASIRLEAPVKSIKNALPGRNNTLRFDVVSMQQNDFFAAPYRGSIDHYPVGPEGFEFLDPPFNAEINADSVTVAWEASRDPDLYDDIGYWLLVDQDSSQVAHAIEKASANESYFQSLEAVNLLVHRRSTTPAQRLRIDKSGDYFWAVVAFDRYDRHVRFAEKNGKKIAKFRVPFPDLQITAVDFEYSPWITEDDYQGKLKITVANTGRRAAKNFAVAIDDSSVIAFTSKVRGEGVEGDLRTPIAETVISELQPGAIDSFAVDWLTPVSGLHNMVAIADAKNLISENDESNNRRRAAFYTIPKGTMTAEDTVAAVIDSRVDYDVPFVAEVFFDSNSTQVRQEYLRDWLLEPILATLADRLKNNPDRQVMLQGFADLNSGEHDIPLANGRAAAVRDSLINFGVAPEQLRLLPGVVLPRRRVPRDPTDAKWVFAERRHVEITTDVASQSILLQPISFSDIEQLPLPVTFILDVRGSVPFRQGNIRFAQTELADSVDLRHVFQGAAIHNVVGWQHQGKDRMVRSPWLKKEVEYDLAITDTLGRRFRMRPDGVYLERREVLREQRIAWPLKFAETQPLYNFYWGRLFSYVNNMLQNPNMRMRFDGHACAVGPDSVNLKLSIERANAFRDRFLEYTQERYPKSNSKIRQRLDNATGYGETRPLGIEHANGELVVKGDNQTPLGRKLNRRIEIVFYSNEKPLEERTTKK